MQALNHARNIVTVMFSACVVNGGGGTHEQLMSVEGELAAIAGHFNCTPLDFDQVRLLGAALNDKHRMKSGKVKPLLRYMVDDRYEYQMQWIDSSQVEMQVSLPGTIEHRSVTSFTPEFPPCAPTLVLTSNP